MKQSPCWESNSHSTSQEIPHLLWKMMVHYCVHKILKLKIAYIIINVLKQT